MLPYKVWGSILTLLNVFLLCLVAIEGYFYIIEEMHSRAELVADTGYWFTVPCDDVSLSLDEDENTFDSSSNEVKVFSDGTDQRICSFTNITQVVEKSTERQSRIRLANGSGSPTYMCCGNENRAPGPGHLTAFFKQPLRNKAIKEKKVKTIIRWDHNQGQSFIGPGIRLYRNGKVQVNESRYYFVYTSISFNQSISRETDCRVCLFSVFVYKENPIYSDYEVRLLETSHMLRDRPGIATVYAGSHIFLSKWDVVYVKVSEEARIITESAGNGFGIFLMA